MAWTDTCKIEAVAHIKNKKKELGGVRRAIHAISAESDIPYGTLRRWYYGDKNVPENGNKRLNVKSPDKFWPSIIRRLKRMCGGVLNHTPEINEELRNELLGEFRALEEALKPHWQVERERAVVIDLKFNKKTGTWG